MKLTVRESVPVLPSLILVMHSLGREVYASPTLASATAFSKCPLLGLYDESPAVFRQGSLLDGQAMFGTDDSTRTHDTPR
jgi:hypothetical protein